MLRLPASAVVLLALALPACRRAAPPPIETRAATTAPAPRLVVRRRKCMGTECEFKAFAADEALVERAFTRGFEEMDRVEAIATSWRETSETSRVNAAAGEAPVSVSPDLVAIVKKALWVSRLSQGAFDITVGVYRGLWQFDEDNDGSLPDPEELQRRRALVNYRDAILDEAASTLMLRRKRQRMNLEGIAKGYAVDAAVRAIRAAGLRDFIVKAGGDLFASGRKGDRAWRVGIQDPRAPHGKIIFELTLEDQAFNTSGDYERFIIRDGTRYHHVLDARTGFPARASRSVTILARDAFTADALDTAIFAMGYAAGMQLIEDLPDVEGVIVDAENHDHVSSGLDGRIVKRGEPTPGI